VRFKKAFDLKEFNTWDDIVIFMAYREIAIASSATSTTEDAITIYRISLPCPSHIIIMRKMFISVTIFKISDDRGE
jgi:hypothetical protein